MLVANLLTTRVFYPYFRDFIEENVKVFDTDKSDNYEL